LITQIKKNYVIIVSNYSIKSHNLLHIYYNLAQLVDFLVKLNKPVDNIIRFI